MKYGAIEKNDEKVIFGDYHFEIRGAGVGVSLYKGDKYLSNYLTYRECICDLSYYYYKIKDLDYLQNLFSKYCNDTIKGPYLYRCSCSEYFWPTEMLFSYVHYADTMSELLEKIELHERRSINYPDKFEFGVQGTGIHIWNKENNSYCYWTGCGKGEGVAEIIQNARDGNKLIPNELIKEYDENADIDVFISHKSEDFAICKPLYDNLMQSGYKVFFAEMSLPALANADYSYEIDKALEKTKNIIVVATSLDKIMSGWVKYEWTAFANEKRGGRKEGNIITIIGDSMNIEELPLLLRQYQVIEYEDMNSVDSYIIKNVNT